MCGIYTIGLVILYIICLLHVSNRVNIKQDSPQCMMCGANDTTALGVNTISADNSSDEELIGASQGVWKWYVLLSNKSVTFDSSDIESDSY